MSDLDFKLHTKKLVKSGCWFTGILILGRLISDFFLRTFYYSLPADSLKGSGKVFTLIWPALENTGVLLSILGLTLLFFWLFNRTSWKTIKPRTIRYFILFCVVLLAWRAGTFSYNYYFEQSFYLDRALVMGLAALTFYHPAGILLFLAEYLLFNAQFNLEVYYANPLINAHFPLSVLFVFLAFLLLKSLIRVKSWWLVSLFLMTIAANYYHAGLQKYLISPDSLTWPLNFRLDLLFAKFFFRGWGQSILSDSFVEFSLFLKDWSTFFVAPIFCLELLMVFILLRKKSSMILLASLGSFHFGLFLLSGLFYWMWALTDFSLILLLFSLPDSVTEKVFNARQCLLGVILIISLTSLGVLKTRSYGWWNTRYVYGFGFQAVNKRNQSFPLKSDNWSPYDPYFWGGFEALAGYGLSKKRLPDSTSNYEFSRRLNRLLINEKVPLKLLEEKLGVNHFNQERTEELSRFIEKIAVRRLRNPSHPIGVLAYLSPPKFFWEDPFAKSYYLSDVPGKVEKITVLFREAIYHRGIFKNRHEKTILTIPLRPGRY